MSKIPNHMQDCGLDLFRPYLVETHNTKESGFLVTWLMAQLSRILRKSDFAYAKKTKALISCAKKTFVFATET